MPLASPAPRRSRSIAVLKPATTKQVADIVSKYVSRQGKVTPLIGRKLIGLDFNQQRFEADYVARLLPGARLAAVT